MDQGYMNIRHVVAAERSYGIQIIGHPMPDSSWQAKAGLGFALPNFVIDWDQHTVTCPMQHASQSWYKDKDSQGAPVFKVKFSARNCHPCSQRLNCTHRKEGGRTLTIRPQCEHDALHKLRHDVQTETFKSKYRRKRAGIEGTLSQGIRANDLRRARYIGLAKVDLQHIATAGSL